MKQSLRSLKGFSLLSILFFTSSLLHAATIYSTTNGNWSSGSTWSHSENGTTCNCTPASGDNVIISSGQTVTVDITNAVCASLQLGSPNSGNGNGTLQFNANTQLTVSSAVVLGNFGSTSRNGILTMTNGGTLICGSIASNSTNDAFNYGTGTIQLTGTSNFPSNDASGNLSDYYNLIVNSGTSALSESINVHNNFTANGGTLNFATTNNSSRTLTVSKNVSISSGTIGLSTANNGTGTIAVAGDFSFTGGTISETGNGTSKGQITFNGVSQTFTSGGTLSGTINFTVNSGATLHMGSGASPAVISNGSSGTFTLLSGGSLGITSPAGITSSGATGNIQVTGTRSFNASATYIYEGSAAQTTGSGLPGSITNLYIQTSNSSNVSLTNALAITGTLHLISGTIDASTNNLTMNNTSTISGGSSSSYVVTGNGSGAGGLVINNISTTGKTFPIGTLNYYLPATVKPAAGSTGLNWTAKVFTPAATNGAYGGPAFDAGQLSNMINAIWTVSHTTATGTAALTLDWTSATALVGTGLAGYPSNAYGISHYNGATWDDAVQTSSTTTSVTYSSFTNFSPFGVGIVGNPLPMILVDFNAAMNSNKTVDLSWTTEMEQNSSHFNVLRSADGTNWSTIGVVQAKGNSSTVSNYSFEDQNPLSGVNYYRLQMVDLDGKYGYSEVKVVKSSLINGLSVFPNPAKDYINVSVGGSTSSLTIRLINQTGQILQEKVVNNTSSSVISMAVYSYPQGNYYLQVTSADGSQQTSKVLITR